MQVGDVVAGRFEIEARIGSGGMGEVHRALDRASGERVALKSLAARGGDAERFLREAQILADLRHPGIVRHIAHGDSGGGALYLAMEWLDGEDLATRLARAPLAVAESLTLLRRATEALGVVHARGVVHRDLKPSNFFLPGGRVESVKILDFGIARTSDVGLTSTGLTLGTPSYMAPEQARGARDVGAAADVFALGCVLFECLTGCLPFTGDHALAILGKILFEEAPLLRELRPDVSPDLEALVARMLAKAAGERPADAAALLDELSSLAALSGAAPLPKIHAPMLTEGEQRLLSVVMAREVASGVAHAATIEAGSPADSLARVRTLAGRYGARIDRIGDGTLMAVIAIRGSATDQSARAARFALDLQAELGDSRVIAATGRGVVSDRWPVGDAIERAAALLRDAADAGLGEVTIDATTAGLVEARFEIRRAEGRISLLRERASVESARLLLGKPTPCVGRDRELSMLETILLESTQDSVARAVLITGAAGAGKSRLLSELLRRIESREHAPQRWIGRADATRAGSPFGLLGRLLRGAMDIRDGDPAPSQQERLCARVALRVEAARQRRVSEFVGEMIGVCFPEEAGSPLKAARRDALLMSDQMARAFEELVDAELEAGPLLIALEDVHWGDPPSLGFLDRILRNLRHRPLMVLAMARPDVRESFPKLWAERDLTEIRLAGLSPKAAERLVRSALGEGLDPARAAAIVERADGNAFYLEELIRAESEGRHDALPETVLAMVQMRLEALSDEARRVLRAGSVFGESFWDGGVRALLGERAGDTGARLDDLAERETVQPIRPSRFPGHREYRFRHAIVREAAYGLLTDVDRALGHRLAARWLTEIGEHDASALAAHHRRGGATELAVACYVRAADQALEANDFAGAILRADEGVACGASGKDLGELRRVQADAHRWSGRVADAAACGREAMDLLPPGSIGWCKAAEACASVPVAEGAADGHGRTERLIDRLLEAEPQGGAAVVLCGAMCMLARTMILLSRFDAARRLLARIEPLVESFDGKERLAIAQLANVRATWARMDGDVSSSVRLNEIALAEYDALGALRQSLFIANNLADCLLQLGDYARAIDVIRSMLPVAEKMALERETSIGHLNLGLALGHLGQTAEALAFVEEAIRFFEARDNRRFRAESLTYRAIILAADGRLDLAAESAREAVDAAAPFPSSLPQALGVLADIELRRDRADEARRLSQEAIEALASLGSILEGAELIRLTHARVLHRAGAVGEAKLAIADARDRILRSAALIGDDALRASFLQRVRVHAETLRLADEWLLPEGDRINRSAG
jgi:tetratricopeptide (TPR) repeat protein